VVGEQKFRLIVSTGGCSMAMVALVRATSVMVARQSSTRPSSSVGVIALRRNQ
jgi:uracil phosphoribosyltransferase